MVPPQTKSPTPSVVRPPMTNRSLSSTNSRQLASREAKSAARIRQLRKIQQNIEDLLSLSHAENCVQSAQLSDVPVRQKYNTEVKRLLKDLGKLIGPSHQSVSAKSVDRITSSDHDNSRIHLQLSNSLARILVAFAKSGRRPSVVVEKTMWKDPQFRDAAEILGIDAPPLPPPQKKLRRIQPVRPL